MTLSVINWPFCVCVYMNERSGIGVIVEMFDNTHMVT